MLLAGTRGRFLTKMVKYFLVGVPETGLGYLINRAMIDAGIDPYLAYAVPALVTGFLIGFLGRWLWVFATVKSKSAPSIPA